MSSRIGWGILGTGNIAETLAKALAASTTSRLVAVGSRGAEKARAFGQKHGVDAAHCHGSYQAMIEDPQVQAVYISLPNHMHLGWTVKCAEAGKHVLCEKPLTTNHAEAKVLVEACRRHKVFMLEAFMYRCHPQTAKIAELVREGAIGEVRVIEAVFAYDMGQKLDNIRQQNEAAGGGIMDVGCYAMSMARLVAGAANGQHVVEPESVRGQAMIGPDSRVDEWAVASVKFPGRVLASLICGTRCNVGNRLHIYGSDGRIKIPNPSFPDKSEDSPGRILVFKKGAAEPQDIRVKADALLYTHEVDVCAKHIAAGDLEAAPPSMTWDDSLGQMRALDMWRASVGLVFDCEKTG